MSLGLQEKLKSKNQENREACVRSEGGVIESVGREGALIDGVEGTGGEGEVGFEASSRLVASATTLLSEARLSSAEEEEEEEGLAL